jgi:hypothetical protein
MVSMPQDRVMDNSGLVLQIAGGLMNFLYGLRILITAFKESVLQGLLVLLLPFYFLYYVATRWDRVAGMFILMLVGSGIAAVGFGLIAAAPYVNKLKNDKNKDGASLFRSQQRSAIVMVCHDLNTI